MARNCTEERETIALTRRDDGYCSGRELGRLCTGSLAQRRLELAGGGNPGQSRGHSAQEWLGGAVVPLLLPMQDNPEKIVSVFVRGVTPESFPMRSRVQLVEGQRPHLGSEEAMIGSNLVGRYACLTVGGSFDIKSGRKIAVVGVFEADGTSFESEVWADRESVRSALSREGDLSSAAMYSSMSQRTKEIGVLRAMGFARGDILGAFLLEATALSLAGASVGVGCALLNTFGQLSTMNGASGAQITFQFVPTAATLLLSFAVGTLIGIVGGFFPSVSAARLNPLRAIRG